LHVIDFFAMQTIFHELSIGYRILGALWSFTDQSPTIKRAFG
jgi:hypothetical protein